MVGDNVKVGFIQYDVKKDKRRNCIIIGEYLKSLECDIVVLPELCNCGYLFEDREQLRAVAENVPDGDFVRELMDLSKLNKCGIIAGMAEIDGGNIYNTAVIIDRGNYIGKYRKIHLSDFEKTLFERGNRNGVYSINGIKVGVQICFDLWFPEVSREQMLESADLLCAIANFGGETTYKISQIRAIENLTPMVLCNRVGEEKSSFLTANFLGLSSVISSSGERIIPGRENVEYAECCDVLLTSLKSNVICDDFSTEILFHHKK